jgi:alkanesulfonate monooxygenase SsuD/methylene tetrahydromethanopterin reductase-like flavin-dependent oxidoreductase (luciferase family)
VSPLRIGLVLPLTSPDADRILSFARRAPELGFDGLFAFDHLFPPGAPPDRPSSEAYASLAAVAAVTERITIGTLVTRASLRSAAMLAKQVAALDGISGGRFVLGIGTGDEQSKAEHDAFGLPYLGRDVRREHLAETVRAVRALFRGDDWPGGHHVPAMTGPLLPRPRTNGGPAVWIGGTGPAAVRLAAREADAWNGWGIGLDVFAERAALLRDEVRGRSVEATWAGAMVVGRTDEEAHELVAERRARGITDDVFAGDVAAAARWLERLASAGASWAILLAAGGRDRVELIAEQLLPRVATLA